MGCRPQLLRTRMSCLALVATRASSLSWAAMVATRLPCVGCGAAQAGPPGVTSCQSQILRSRQSMQETTGANSPCSLILMGASRSCPKLGRGDLSFLPTSLRFCNMVHYHSVLARSTSQQNGLFVLPKVAKLQVAA